MSDTYYLQINGKTSIENPLDIESEISVAFNNLSPSGVTKKPLEENGEFSHTYKYKNIGEVTVIKGKEVITGKKKKTSMSQKLRFELKRLWNEQFSAGIEFETFYEQSIKNYIKEISDTRDGYKYD